MVLAERNVVVKDRERLDYLIAELRAIDDEIKGELEDYRHDAESRDDLSEYGRQRRKRLYRLISEVYDIAEKYQ